MSSFLIFNRGLRPLLNRWANKGFGPDLRRLQMLLEAGNMQEAEMKVTV